MSPYFQGVQPIVLDVDGTTIEPMANDTNNMFGLFESLDDEQLAAANLTAGLHRSRHGTARSTPGTRSRKVCRTPSSPPNSKTSCVRSSPTGWPTPPPSWPSRCWPSTSLELDETVIGWSTSINRESAAYMRIDGPRVWIEWLNRENPGEAGFHPHTVYRDKLIDYGTGADVVPDVVEEK